MVSRFLLSCAKELAKTNRKDSKVLLQVGKETGPEKRAWAKKK